MGGVNTAAIAEIIDALYLLIGSVSGLIGIHLFSKSWVAFSWAAQMGAMNSMGTRSFAGEAVGYFVGGLIALNATGFALMGAEDLTGTNSIAWRPISGQTENPMQFIGEFLIASFYLIGFSLIIKAGMMLPKISQGAATFGGFTFTFIFGILCMAFEWVNTNFINEVLPFNPLGLFFPGSSLITL